MKRIHSRLIACSLAAVALAGCASDMLDAEATGKPDGGDVSSGGKEDQWNRLNGPERFDGQFNYHLADLPREGRAAEEAWPSTYWPTYEDSVNHRWQGRSTGNNADGNPNWLSPAEKYDLAFNGWTMPEGFADLRPFDRYSPEASRWDAAYYDQLGPLARHVSQNMGNRRDREAAASANGRPDEWPVQTWWGLCHAWVPASMNEERPLHAVEYHGVRFEVGDMEALLIAAYNRTPAQMIGGRCNRNAPGDEDYQVERDEHGRITNEECRDTNAGALHVILTNYLGLNQRAFAYDRTWDFEVWNQPVVGFEVTSLAEITLGRALELLNRAPEADAADGDSATLTYPFNDEAVSFQEVRATVTYISESHASTTPNDASRYERTDNYHYILELDGDGKIIGGEWLSSSRPDFLWNPSRLTRSSTPHLDLDNIRMLVQMSRQVDPPGGGADGGDVNMAIPDNDPNGIVARTTVSDSTIISGVQVELNITHTYRGDLMVVLAHNGEEQTLHNRAGGSADDIQTTITAPGFRNVDAQGTWELRVSDHAGQDVGTLVSWRLHFLTDSGSGSAETFTGTADVAIPDNADFVTSTAVVPSGVSGSAVEVSVNIEHTWIGDLTVMVEHNGQEWTLHNQTGGSQDNLVQSVVLNPAPSTIAGEYVLRVKDSAAQDVGRIASWGVTVR